MDQNGKVCADGNPEDTWEYLILLDEGVRVSYRVLDRREISGAGYVAAVLSEDPDETVQYFRVTSAGDREPVYTPVDEEDEGYDAIVSAFRDYFVSRARG